MDEIEGTTCRKYMTISAWPHGLEPDDEAFQDEDGYCIGTGVWSEISDSERPIDVRILAGTDQDEAVTMLRKIADWLEQHGHRFSDSEGGDAVDEAQD